MLRRSPGFFKYHKAKTNALLAGAPVEEIIKIEDAWVRGEISWREAVKRLEKLERSVREGEGWEMTGSSKPRERQHGRK